MNFCILGSVKSLEICGFVDRDVSVDCHEDDDVNTGGHEGVDQGQLEVGLIEGSIVGGGVEANGDVMECGYGSDQNTQVGHGQAKQVHVHYSCNKNKNIRSQENVLEII